MDTHDTHILATPRDLIRWAVSRFNEAGLYFGHGTDNALDEAAYLVLHTLHLPLDLPASYLEAALTASERAAVLAVLQRRVEERVPAAYLTGEAWFAGLPFFVTPDVLVPRSPIAELIEHHFEPWVDPHRVERILDLCTGSGCIGIAAASYFPDAMVDISDISTPALAVARGNVARHHLEGQVRVVESDLFEGLRGEHYDVIVSNPPYVDARDMRDLPEEFHREPRLGLAGGEDGLDLVARILAEAENHLNPDGILVVEVGNSAEALVQRYPTLPFTWFEFERGGDGVLLLSAEQLGEHRSELAMGPE